MASQVVVESIELLKSGVGKNGKPYSLYKIHHSGGQEATGFNEVVVGQQVFVYPEEYRGQQQWKFSSDPPKGQGYTSGNPPAANVPKRSAVSVLASELGVSEQHIRDVLTAAAPTPPQEVVPPTARVDTTDYSQDPISMDDIPF